VCVQEPAPSEEKHAGEKENLTDATFGPASMMQGVKLGVGFNADFSQARIPMHSCPHCARTFASVEYVEG
jgi:hypothetical protein